VHWYWNIGALIRGQIPYNTVHCYWDKYLAQCIDTGIDTYLEHGALILGQILGKTVHALILGQILGRTVLILGQILGNIVSWYWDKYSAPLILSQILGNTVYSYWDKYLVTRCIDTGTNICSTVHWYWDLGEYIGVECIDTGTARDDITGDTYVILCQQARMCVSKDKIGDLEWFVGRRLRFPWHRCGFGQKQ
jgi:hypothetical protein